MVNDPELDIRVLEEEELDVADVADIADVDAAAADVLRLDA